MDETMIPTTEIPEIEVEPLPGIYCSECHTLIGFYVTVGKQTWLQVGSLQLKCAHGRCCVCHTEYHWSASDKMLEDLINKCKK
jgi:hypothetical protein